MNTLSKYDIADVVSHISGNTKAPEAEASERSPFAALLAKAVESIPDSKAEGKVAEGGNNLPGYMRADKEYDGENKLRYSLDHKSRNEKTPDLDLARALFAPFMRNHELSSPPELASQAQMEIGENGEEKASTISKALNALKDSSRIHIQSQNILAKDAVGSSDEREIDILPDESAVRVTTLKQKRPVILGPGHIMSGRLQGQALANYFDNLSLKNGEHSSVTPGSTEEGDLLLATSVDAKPVSIASNPHSVDAKPVSNASNPHSLEKPDTKNQSEKFKMSGDNGDVRQQMEISSRTHVGVSDTEKRPLSALDNSELTQTGALDIRGSENSIKAAQQPENSEPYKNLSGHVDPRLPSFQKLDETAKGFVKGKGDEDKVQPGVAERNARVNNQGLSTNHSESLKIEVGPITKKKTERPLVPEASSQRMIDKDPIIVDEKSLENLSQKIPGTETFKLAEKIAKDSKVSQGQAVLASDLNEPAVLNLAGNLSSKKADGEIKRSGILSDEIEGGIEKSSVKFNVSDSVEISIDSAKRTAKTDLMKTNSPDHDLTPQGVDSNIKSAEGDNIESGVREALVSSQIDKAPTPNRSELLPRPVSVSNFSSDVRETIVGQLTNPAKGTSKFTVALFPENFGKISIEISYSEAAGLKINMIGDNPEATKILEQNLPSLRENLQSEKLSELIVNLNSNKDSHNSNNKNGQSDGENFSEGLKSENFALESEEPSGNERNRGQDSDGNLDTYV